jgi:uncharacterized membrane protein
MGICPWIVLALIGTSVSIAGENLSCTGAVLPPLLLIPGCLLIAALMPGGASGGTGHPGTWFRRKKAAEEGGYTAADREGFSDSAVFPAEQALSLVLIAVLLVAVGMTVFIIVSPQEGERFTEFYILGPTGKAADYPKEFMAGTPQTVILGIGNHESRDIAYTVETFAVESRFDSATNETVIVSATPLDRFSVTVPNNRTVEQPYTFRIMNPEVNRIEFLLFTEEPPEDIPLAGLTRAGYRNLHLQLWVH